MQKLGINGLHIWTVLFLLAFKQRWALLLKDYLLIIDFKSLYTQSMDQSDS